MKTRILVAITIITGLYFVFSADFSATNLSDTAALPPTTPALPSSSAAANVEPEHTPITLAQPASLPDTEAFEEEENTALSLAQCVEADLLQQQFEREKEQLLHDYLLDLDDQGVSLDQMLALLTASRIDVYSTLLRSSDNPQFLHPALRATYTDNLGTRVDVTKYKHFVDWAYSRKYDAIIAAISRGELDPTNVYLYYDLMTLIVSSNPQITETELTQLLSAGVLPSLASLVVLTEQGRPPAILQLMLSFGADVPVNEPWGTYEKKQNLLIYSLSENKMPQALYWYEQGNAVYLQHTEFSALDVFPTPSSPEATELLVNIVRRFASEQRYPTHLARLREIKSWLPDDVQEELSDYLAIGFERLSEITESTHGQKLNELLAALSLKYQQKAQVENCTFEPQYVHYQMERERDWQLESRKEVGSPLWLMRQVNRIDASTVNNKPGKQKLIRELLTNENNWGELKERLDNGERLPDDAVLILAARNQAQMMRDLLGYGLNVHAKDAVGNNAWHSAILAFDSFTGTMPFDVMNVLIENQVDIHQGRDIFIHALDKRGGAKGITELLSFLEKAGGTLEKQQFQYVHHRFKGYSPNFHIIVDWYKKRLNLS